RGSFPCDGGGGACLARSCDRLLDSARRVDERRATFAVDDARLARADDDECRHVGGRIARASEGRYLHGLVTAANRTAENDRRSSRQVAGKAGEGFAELPGAGPGDRGGKGGPQGRAPGGG